MDRWDHLRQEGEKKAAEAPVDADGFWPNDDTEEGDVLLGFIRRRYEEDTDFGRREQLELDTKRGIIRVGVTKQIQRILDTGRSKPGDGIYLRFAGWHEFDTEAGETIRYRKFRGAIVPGKTDTDSFENDESDDDLPF